VLAPGPFSALFAGVYPGSPKVTGRKMSELLGKLHFGPSFLVVKGIFMPMFFQGLAGVSRRLWDPTQYAHAQAVQPTNVFMSICAWGLGLAQVPFIVNFFWSIFFGKKADNNPWQATTLEWTAPSPPSHGNFDHEPVVYRGPYEYSVPGQKNDFWPQAMKDSN